eukprot:790165-Prymnesium_polylepis.3
MKNKCSSRSSMRSITFASPFGNQHQAPRTRRATCAARAPHKAASCRKRFVERACRAETVHAYTHKPPLSRIRTQRAIL